MEKDALAARDAAKKATGVILAATVAYALINSLLNVLINEIIDAFRLVGAAQGLASSMLSVGMMAALLLGPLLQGRVQKLTLLLIAGLLQAVSLAASGAATAFGFYLAAVLILGMGCGWVDSAINSGMVDAHPQDGKKYLGLMHGLFGVGSLLSPLLARRLLGAMSWRGVSYLMAGAMLLAMLYTGLTLLRMRRANLSVREMTEQRLRLRDVGAYLGKGRNLLLLLCGAMTAMVQGGVICWIVRYMTVRYDAAALGALCVSIYWAAATVNRFLAPRIKARALTLVVVGALLSAAFLAAGVLSGSAAFMCVTVGLIGLTTGHFMPMMVSECAEGYAGNTTLTTSVLMFVMGAARVVIPLGMAAATSAVSAQAGMLLPAIAALLCALFGALARGSRRT